MQTLTCTAFVPNCCNPLWYLVGKRDIPVLRDILAYKMGPPHFIEPVYNDETTACYIPPIDVR